MDTILRYRLWGRAALFGLAMFALVSVSVALNVRLRGLEPAWVEPPLDESRKWDPRFFEIISFGHLPVLIDWFWLKTIQDPAIIHVPKGRHPQIYYDLDLATDLDPAFFELYVAGANLLAVIRNDGPGARNLLLKGNRFRKERLPTYSEKFQANFWGAAWNIPVLMGYVYLFELEDMPKAADAFKEAAGVPGVPAYVVRLKDRLERPNGEYDVGIRLLSFLLEGATDPVVRDKLLEKRRSLEVAKFIFDMNRRFRESGTGSLPRFLQRNGLSPVDPWGGKLSLNPEGRIVTTTPYRRVFGLE